MRGGGAPNFSTQRIPRERRTDRLLSSSPGSDHGQEVSSHLIEAFYGAWDSAGKLFAVIRNNSSSCQCVKIPLRPFLTLSCLCSHVSLLPKTVIQNYWKRRDSYG